MSCEAAVRSPLQPARQDIVHKAEEPSGDKSAENRPPAEVNGVETQVDQACCSLSLALLFARAVC
jgi:hypothetical protein